MIAALINGEPVANTGVTLNVMDRGLHYGDGVFETMRLENDRLRNWPAHFRRLQAGCERLQVTAPSQALVENEIAKLTQGVKSGVVKLIVTRGEGGRGYRPPTEARPTRVISLHTLPLSNNGIVVRWCDTRWSRNARLAGIKHLNRLEQVLAQNEWHDDAIDEGIMLDTEGEVISATASNIFIVKGESLVTPDLRFSGIRGVLRERVLHAASALQLAIDERAVWPHDIQTADEVFVTNAVRGIRSVLQLESKTWSTTTLTCRLRDYLAHHE